MKTSIALSTAFALVCSTANGFSYAGMTSVRSTSLMAQQQEGNEVTTRRDALFGIAAAMFAGVGTASMNPQAASATYSAYTHREEDWQKRVDKGEIKIVSARALKQELREIVPQNSEGSKIFCPNGPSAAVSPLMENKCGDRMAAPSVYGRQDDIVGNSIPGFKSGYVGGGTASLSASSGGFPSYKENEYQLKRKPSN